MSELNGFRIHYSPQCTSCAFFLVEKGKMTCRAYPDEIPDKWVFNEAVHDTVQKDQVGDYVYTDQSKP